MVPFHMYFANVYICTYIQAYTHIHIHYLKIRKYVHIYICTYTTSKLRQLSVHTYICMYTTSQLRTYIMDVHTLCTYIPGIIIFVITLIIWRSASSMNRRSFQFPVIKTVQEHFCQIIHHLPVCLLQTSKFVHNEVSDCLEGGKYTQHLCR